MPLYADLKPWGPLFSLVPPTAAVVPAVCATETAGMSPVEAEGLSPMEAAEQSPKKLPGRAPRSCQDEPRGVQRQGAAGFSSCPMTLGPHLLVHASRGAAWENPARR